MERIKAQATHDTLHSLCVLCTEPLYAITYAALLCCKLSVMALHHGLNLRLCAVQCAMWVLTGVRQALSVAVKALNLVGSMIGTLSDTECIALLTVTCVVGALAGISPIALHMLTAATAAFLSYTEKAAMLLSRAIEEVTGMCVSADRWLHACNTQLVSGSCVTQCQHVCPLKTCLLSHLTQTQPRHSTQPYTARKARRRKHGHCRCVVCMAEGVGYGMWWRVLPSKPSTQTQPAPHRQVIAEDKLSCLL